MKKLMRFLKNEDGVTSVEYAVMVALIAAVVIAGATLLGTATDNKLTDISGQIDAAS
jgi:pilus assembly protein Flp/PilA